MRRPILTLLALLSLWPAVAGASGDPLPARLAGREGFVWPGGGIAIPFRFEAAGRFADGRAVVALGPPAARRYGLIDGSGRSILDPIYPELQDFHEGLARCARETDEGLRYGFVDPEGVEAIPPRFDYAGDFAEGLAPAGAGERFGYIDATGEFRILLERSPEFLGPFHEGLAVVQYDALNHFVIDRVGAERFGSAQGLGWRVGSGLLCAYSSSRESYSFLDLAGRRAIPDDFSFALPFSEGLALVKVRGETRMGFIDSSGAQIVPPRYRQAGDFSEGLAAVQVDVRWGFVDSSGRQVIPPRFFAAGAFRNGWAAVLDLAGPNHVDREGKLAWDPAEHPVQPREREFFAALSGEAVLAFDRMGADVRLETGALLAVHRREVEALRAARRRPGAELLLQGENRHLLFAVAGADSALPEPSLPGRALLPGYRVSLLDPDLMAERFGPARADSIMLGVLLLARWELSAEELRALYRRLPVRRVAAVGFGINSYPQLLDAGDTLPAAIQQAALAPLPQRDAQGNWGFGDLAGRPLLPAAWRWIGEFSEGLAPVSPDSLRIGFVNPAGTMVIPPRYQGVGRFSEGLCTAIEADLGGYIDRAGEWVITPRYSWSGDFRTGLAPASLDGRSVGFIDSTGAFVIAPEIQLAGEFSEGLAPVLREGRAGYLGRDGRLAIPCRFEAGTGFSEGLAAVRLDGRVGYIDPTGTLVIPARFTAGSAFQLGVALAVLDGELRVIDRSGDTLWIPAP